MKYNYNGHDFDVYILKRRQKNIILRVKNDGTIRVSAPHGATLKMIEDALKKSHTFLDSYLSEYKGDKITILGHTYHLSFHKYEKDVAYIQGENLAVFYKKDPKVAVKKYLKNRLKEIIDEIFLKACREFYIDKIPSIKYHDLKSAYGKYYRNKNEIVLAINLVKYEFKYIELVLYHELTHYYYFDHSNNFYALFELKYPGGRSLQRQMNRIKYMEPY